MSGFQKHLMEIDWYQSCHLSSILCWNYDLAFRGVSKYTAADAWSSTYQPAFRDRKTQHVLKTEFRRKDNEKELQDPEDLTVLI